MCLRTNPPLLGRTFLISAISEFIRYLPKRNFRGMLAQSATRHVNHAVNR